MKHAQCMRRTASLLFTCMVACRSAVGGGGGSDAPVGVVLEAGDGLPALEMAVLTRPSVADDKLVAPLATALRSGALACRGEVGESAFSAALAAGMTLGFRSDHETLSALAGNASSPPSACLSRSFTKAELQRLEPG